MLQLPVSDPLTKSQWSPCSSFIALLAFDRALVLNTSLEIVQAWLTEVPRHLFPHKLAMWGPGRTLMTVVCAPHPQHSFMVQKCWHPSEAEADDGSEVAHAKAMLAALADTGEALQQIAWGPSGAIAAVTELQQAVTVEPKPWEHNKAAAIHTHRLSVLTPGSTMSTMTLKRDCFSFSPAGDRLLVQPTRTDSSLQLVTIAARSLLSLNADAGCIGRRKTVFSPDGRHLAVAFDVRWMYKGGLALYKAITGEEILSIQAISLSSSFDLSFNSAGNQLILMGRRIACIGWGSGACSNSQVCNAIAAACSWTSRMAEEGWS